MFIYFSILILISSPAGRSDSQSSPSSGSVNFNIQNGVTPLNFGSANNDFGAPGFGPYGAIHSGTSTFTNIPTSARSFSGSVRVREGMFSENGGFDGYDAIGRSRTMGNGAPSTSYAHSGSSGFGTGIFGHASGLVNGRLNDANEGMLGSLGGLTQSGNGVEHRHSRFVSNFGSGLPGGSGPDIGNGARSATSFVHSSNFEKYTEIGGVGNSDQGSGSLELSKGSGPRIGSSSLRSVANVFGNVGNIRNNLDSTVYPSSNVDSGTRIETGIKAAGKSGSSVRTRNGRLFGTEPNKERVDFGSGTSSNVSSHFIISGIRGSHSGGSKDYWESGRLSDVGIPEAATSIEGAGRQLRAFQSVSGSHSLSRSGSNSGANEFGGLIGAKQGESETARASDEFSPGAGNLHNLLVTKNTGFGVGGSVIGSAGGDGKGELLVLERGKVLSNGRTGPALTISQSSSRSLKSSTAGSGSTSGMGTSDFDDGIRGLGVKGTFDINKGFIRSSSAYTLERSELKRSFGSGHMGLTPGGSHTALESPDNFGIDSASNAAENISPTSPRKGLVFEEVSGGARSDSESLLGSLRNSENVKSLGGGGGSISSSSSSSSTGTVGDSGFESTSDRVESSDIKNQIRLSSRASEAHTSSIIDLKDSGETVDNLGSLSVSNKSQNGFSISRRSAWGLSDVRGKSGSGTGNGVRDIGKSFEDDSSEKEGDTGKPLRISSRGSKSGSGSVTFGGPTGTLEGASRSGHRPTSNHGDRFSGSGDATMSGLRGPAERYEDVYIVRESSSLQSGFDGEGGSRIGSHYRSGGTTGRLNSGSDGSTTINLGGSGGGSGPEGSPGLGGNSVLIGGVSKLRDASGDFRDGVVANDSQSGTNNGTFRGSVDGLDDSVLSGSKRDTGSVYGAGGYIIGLRGLGSSTFGSYAGSSSKSGRNYGFDDDGRYGGNNFGTESKSQITSDSDVSEGSAITLGGSINNYGASDLGAINHHENTFGSGGKKSYNYAFGSSTGKFKGLRNSYGLDGSDDGGKRGSVIIFGDGNNIQRGSTNGDSGDTSSSSFGSNHATSGLSGISGSQNIFRTSYIASRAHSVAIDGSSGSPSGLLRNPQLETGGVLIKNSSESTFGRGSEIHTGSNRSAFEGSIGRTSNLGNYGLEIEAVGRIKGIRSDVTPSQIQSELSSDTSASSAGSLIGGSRCGGSFKSGVDGCVEGNIKSHDEHQWKTASFGKGRNTGESVNSENFDKGKYVEVHTTGNPELGGGLEGSNNFGSTSRLNIDTGTSTIVDENWKERAVDDVYEIDKLKSGSSSSGAGGIVHGGFSGIKGTHTGGFNAGGLRVEEGSIHGGETRGSLGGNILGSEFSSNVKHFRSVGDYRRYIDGLRELSEIAVRRGTGESAHETGLSFNDRGNRGSSSLGGLSSGGAEGIFGEINPYSIRGSVVQSSSSSSSFGESTSAGGSERREPDEFGINNGSKDGFVVAGFWRSGGIPDCGSSLDEMDAMSNSGIGP
jgi:hypothetical protein